MTMVGWRRLYVRRRNEVQSSEYRDQGMYYAQFLDSHDRIFLDVQFPDVKIVETVSIAYIDLSEFNAACEMGLSYRG